MKSLIELLFGWLLKDTQAGRSYLKGHWYRVAALPYGPGPFTYWTRERPACTHWLLEEEVY